MSKLTGAINEAIVTLQNLLSKADDQIQRDDLPEGLFHEDDIMAATDAIQNVAGAFGDAADYVESWEVAERMLERIAKFDGE